MTFTEELTRQGLINERGISEALRLADEKYDGVLEDALIEKGIPEETLLDIKSTFYNIPKRNPDVKTITLDTLKYIPEDSARHYHFAPIALENGVLIVGVTNPDDIGASDALQFIAQGNNVPFKIVVISEIVFKKILDIYKSFVGVSVDNAMSEIDSQVKMATAADVSIPDTKNIQDTLKPGEEERIVEEAPIIKIVAVILNNAVEGKASDIHIENTGEKVKVRFRVDGILHTSLFLPLPVFPGVVARIKILAKMRLDEKRKPQDGGFSAKIGVSKIDFRVSTLPAYYGEKVVLRILDSERGVKKLDDLGLSESHVKMIREAIAKPYGLILVTGPTGSGKSTTLYSLINELDKEEDNVVSLEDPVEYHIPDMNQSQVMPEIGYNFANGLRSILRQDPDVIMVGEIRDAETAQLAIQAALTGHLVFSTLHTNSAIGVIPRLIDMGIDPYLIAPTLVLSIAQRLVRTTYDKCAHEAADQDSLHQMAEKQFADLPKEYRDKIPLTGKFTDVVPAPDCPSGTRGRTVVMEMFPTTKELQALILKKPVDNEIYDLVRKNGFTTMKEDAIVKCIQGHTPFQEIYNL
jgi:type IV pilus assembly protein PilB